MKLDQFQIDKFLLGSVRKFCLMLRSKNQQRKEHNQESSRPVQPGKPIQIQGRVMPDLEPYSEECLQQQIDLPPKLSAEAIL